MSTEPLLFFTDAPPMREGGIGGHFLAYSLIRDFGEAIRMVMTRRGWRTIEQKDIYHAAEVETVIFPDATWFWPGRLRPWMEMLLFVLWLPRLARAVKHAGCKRLFALIGGDSWFLPKIELLRWATGLPLDIYLIDDLEASCLLVGDPIRARITRWVEGYVLRRADRIFAISPGYVEHLAAKYRVPSVWLPLVINRLDDYTPFECRVPDVRSILFLGSINPLYLEGLLTLYGEISRWNRQPHRPYQLRLRVLTRFEPTALIASLPDRDFLDLALNLNAQGMFADLRTAWALFLPYSFDPALRVMVSTSFSHKFTESIAVGRPVIVFGPEYASIPRYFREQNIPLRAHSPAELARALSEVEQYDNKNLVEHYHQIAEQYHSPAHLRQLIDAGNRRPVAQQKF